MRPRPDRSRLALPFAAALALASFSGTPAPALAAAPEPVVMEGTLVTAFCYLKHGSTGTDHADCARTCSEAGAPPGLLTDAGEYVPLLAYAGDIAGHMEGRVRVSGQMRDGYLWAEKLEVRDGDSWRQVKALPGTELADSDRERGVSPAVAQRRPMDS